MVENLSALGKSDKILIGMFELSKLNKNKITVEDVSVKIWQMWPSEFCMRGYPQYPNVDIQKYITKLLDNNFITGGVYNYKITEKGKDYVKSLIEEKHQKSRKKGEVSAEEPRHIRSEISRIINSKVFKYYLEDTSAKFLESDFFEFLGTSARSLSTKDRNVFLTRYNTIIKDIIPYCDKIKDKDEYAKKIVKLWELLIKQFGNLLDKNK